MDTRSRWKALVSWQVSSPTASPAPRWRKGAVKAKMRSNEAASGIMEESYLASAPRWKRASLPHVPGYFRGARSHLASLPISESCLFVYRCNVFVAACKTPNLARRSFPLRSQSLLRAHFSPGRELCEQAVMARAGSPILAQNQRGRPRELCAF